METIIHKKEIGKLKIYLKAGENVKKETFIHSFFQKKISRKLLEEAKKANLMNAHVYHTHLAFERGQKIQQHVTESGNEGLILCMELVDEKDKLEDFVVQQKKLLANKTIIYKPVELWSVNNEQL